MATSPGLSVLEFVLSPFNNEVAGNAAPASPMPFRNERRLTTRSQSELMSSPADGEIEESISFSYEVLLFFEHRFSVVWQSQT
jgi:hypothetical protein